MGLADALVREMPCTMAALTAGAISEWRATIVTRETACLSADDRRQVDAAVASRLPSLSSRQVVAETRTHAYRLDAQSIVARSSQAVADRRVTLRPAPDTMAWLSALLPVAQGVALYSALTKEADSRRAQGDERSRGQVMADTLVERVTSQGRADRVPVEVQLLMTDKTLLAGDQTAARVQGYGPIPAPLARSILAGFDDETPAWLRRLYTDPTSGQLIAMESRRRLIPPGLRRIIDIRDEWCRTPWCGAPIRHGDHPEPVAAGGLTTEANAQGLCEACNLAKEAPGWRSRPDPDGGAGHAVTITTPTGHAYTSHPPPLPGAPPVGGSQRAIASTRLDHRLPLRPIHDERVTSLSASQSGRILP